MAGLYRRFVLVYSTGLLLAVFSSALIPVASEKIVEVEKNRTDLPKQGEARPEKNT